LSNRLRQTGHPAGSAYEGTEESHVVRRSDGMHDVAAYFTVMGRKFDVNSKAR